MLKRRRTLFAALLAVIYITAGLFSSLSVLTCDAHHHIYASTECACGDHCGCAALAFSEDCDCHYHPTLEDNDNYYATSTQRSSDLRYVVLQFFALSSVVIPSVDSTLSDGFVAYLPRSGGDEAEPLQAAFISSRALRAPPVLA